MLFNTQFYLFLYTFIVPFEILGASINSILQRNTFEDEVWILAHQIIRQYFEDEYLCLTYISSDLEEAWFLKTKLPVFSIDLTDDYSQDDIILQSYNENCGGYVIRSKPERKEEIINSLYSAFTNATIRYNIQRYLFLPYDENDHEFRFLSMKEMFWFPELNMITLHSSHPNNFSIITHNWFHGYKYDVLGISHEAIEYWTAEHGFEFNTDLYYDRTLNVHGKQLLFALIHYIPYALILKDENNNSYYDGIETRMLAMYVNMINGTYDAFDHPKLFWGSVYEDGHADGILGSVRYHRADFGFAGIYDAFCIYLGCSYPYIQAEVTCLVPRPRRMSGWLTVVLPFTPHTWLGLIITYNISSMFVFFLMSVKAQMKAKKPGKEKPFISGQTFFDAYYNTFRLQIEQIPKIADRKDSIGVYFKFCNIYYFFVACCWIGGVASLLTLPRFEDAIVTTEDLIKRQDTIEWGANAISWVESIINSENPYVKTFADKFVVLDDETLNKRTRTRDFAFIMERLPHGHFGFMDYIDEESLKYLQIMGGTIFTATTQIFQPRGSPWQRGLDKLIFRLLDAGLIQKLEIQVSLDVVNNRLQEMIRTSNAKPVEEQSPLLLRHLEGPIFIYVGGMSIAIITFFLELSYHKILGIVSTTKFKNSYVEFKKGLANLKLSRIRFHKSSENQDLVLFRRNGPPRGSKSE